MIQEGRRKEAKTSLENLSKKPKAQNLSRKKKSQIHAKIGPQAVPKFSPTRIIALFICGTVHLTDEML